jgi:mono/diheme cytochrome c family protein
MKSFRSFAFLVAAASLAACSGGGSDPVLKGQAAFTGFGCVKCHTIGGEGGTYGPDLTFVGFRKSKQWIDMWLTNPHAWKPTTAMPNFHLPEEVRAELVEYLSAQKGDGYRKGNEPWQLAELKDDQVKRGETIFNKAGCVACHGLRGAGGYPNNNVAGGQIPSLTNAADGYSKDELKTLLHKGRIAAIADPSQPAPMINMPEWGKVLKDDEIDSVVEFVYSLKPKATKGDEW